MQRKEKEGVEWLEFELFADIPYLTHGVFMRHGGVSRGSHKSLNVAKDRGDDPEAVKENLFRIQKIIGLDHLISVHQVHGTCITYVDHSMTHVPPCDGLLTDHAGLGLMMMHADCQVAIFLDPKLKVLANVHCGWRGNVQNFYGLAVLKMQEAFGCRPENILVGVTPSLGPDKSEFINYRNELPESFLPYQIRPTYFDLWAIARMQLESAGILPHHIEIASLCTYSHAQDFFSYRRDRRITGNHATVASLKYL